ncbi:HAD family hydrolase [Chloroflexota bacterium]
MSIKGVFFDLVGTLLIYGDMTSELSEWQSEFYRCLQKHGLSLSKETFIEHCNDVMVFNKNIQNPAGNLTIFECRIESLCSDLGVSIEVQDIKDISTALVYIWSKYLPLDPDCIPMLEILRQNKTLALISNFDHPPYVYDTVTKFGIKEYFKTIIVSSDVGIKKPDPGIFHLALQRTGLQPEEVVYIGDTDDDIQGSLSAGITPILIQRKQTETNVPARYSVDENPVLPPFPSVKNLEDVKIISSLSELTDILE